MNRQAIFGKDDLWIVILWSDEQLYDVVRGSEIYSGDLLVNGICEVKYKRQTYSAKICFILNTKEEATRKMLELEKGVDQQEHLFYTRKYQFYNLSAYENATKREDCFVWGESDGKRGALEISTCISKWLNGLVQRKAGKLKIILYCDNCPGQNKNKTMFSMLLYHAQKMPSVESIQLKFLLKGHTYMGADTIHSTISSFVKHRQVMVPCQWPYIIQLS